MWLMSNEDFNADEFLVDITKEWNDLPRVASSANTFRNSPPPPLPRPITRVDTEILYRCPLHESEALQKKKTVTKYGEWEYYKCPVAKCFVSCGADRVEYYIDSGKRQCTSSTSRMSWTKCSATVNFPWECPSLNLKKTLDVSSSFVPNVTASSSSGSIKPRVRKWKPGY